MKKVQTAEQRAKLVCSLSAMQRQADPSSQPESSTAMFAWCRIPATTPASGGSSSQTQTITDSLRCTLCM